MSTPTAAFLTSLTVLVLRLLERLKIPDMRDVGVRVVVQRSPERGVQIGDASLQLFGQSGRYALCIR
jgi:hypothetical protein